MDDHEKTRKQLLVELSALRQQIAMMEKREAPWELDQLREREADVRLIVDNVPILIAYIDCERYLRFVNQTLAHWLCISPEAALNRHIQEVVGESAYLTVSDYVDEALLGRTVSFELEMPYVNGSRYVNGRYVPHVDEQGEVQGFFALIVDLTDVKRLEAQLLQTQKMEAIGTFASGIAHEFNNILNVVMAYIGLAQAEIPQSSPAQAHLAEVDTALERAKDLLKQMLTFSRQTTTAYAPLDFNALVQDALRFFRVSIPKNIQIRQHGGQEPLMVMADSTQLHQILMNLFANAECAMRQTGGRLEVELAAVELAAADGAVKSDEQTNAYVRLAVRDTGIGMPPEVRDRIFEPFYTTKAVGEGTGMGLAIVQGIVSSHGGKIVVDSQPGKGTTFVIYLPRCREASAKRSAPEAVTSPELGRILLVDDEPALTRVMGGALMQLGYQVVSHNDPESGLAAFEAKPQDFDLIITDQAMPGLSGVQLAHRLRQIRANVPIILCSGISQTSHEVKAWETRFDAFCAKPLRVQELSEIIQQVFSQRQGVESG